MLDRTRISSAHATLVRPCSYTQRALPVHIITIHLRVYDTHTQMTFLLGVTPVMHDFWNSPEDPNEMIQFLKNLALFGCLLTYASMASSAKKSKSKMVKLKKSN